MPPPACCPPQRSSASTHGTQASLEDRVTLRKQDVAEVDDEDQYDCVWVPTFFLAKDTFTQALPRLTRATRPGGWIVLGRFAPPPDPFAEATATLRTIRGGGFDLDGKRAVELLEQAGCKSVLDITGADTRPIVGMIRRAWHERDGCERKQLSGGGISPDLRIRGGRWRARTADPCL